MHNLRSFYYKNKQKIWKIVIIIAAILGGIYFINYNITPGKNNSNQVLQPQIYYDNENKTYISDKSAVSGGSITNKEAENINNTISKFLQYCKSEKYEDAYNMISLDCKEKKYSTLDKFIQKYIKTKFNKNYVYEIKKWMGNTYRVSILEDKLTTGKVGSNKKTIEYITIVKENSQDRLNIGDYIGGNALNKEETQYNVKIIAKNRQTYMDYEIYNLKIENLSNKTIKLDAFERMGTIYLVDSNGNMYEAYNNEILEDDLIILPKRTFEILIKFSNEYSYTRNIRQIVFSNFVLDYDEYEKDPDSVKLSEFVINLH